MYSKACSKCKEYLSEDDMFPKLKNGKYSKRCYNCSCRTMELIMKIISSNEMESSFENNNIVMVN